LSNNSLPGGERRVIASARRGRLGRVVRSDTADDRLVEIASIQAAAAISESDLPSPGIKHDSMA
jgi:hypothetical protein